MRKATSTWRARDPAREALRRALARLPGFEHSGRLRLQPLALTGLQHSHVRIRGARPGGGPALLRIPRASHWGLAPAENLAYQAAVFRRAAPSGHTPALLGTIPPEPAIPFGALVVEEIAGRPPRLPAELPALAEALAAIHALPLPRARDRAPLIDQADPVAATLAIIVEQARYLESADIAPAARREIEDELAWARDFAATAARRRQPRRLVLTDTQPGNFIIERTGRAVAVDLEKAVYGAPAIDLAHLTLAPSTGWHPAAGARLTPAHVAGFYRHYLAVAEPAFAAALRPWLAPARRLTWLRTVTIFAKMTAQARAGTWTGADLDPAFRAHVVGHIAASHRLDAIRADRAEWLAGQELDL